MSLRVSPLRSAVAVPRVYVIASPGRRGMAAGVKKTKPGPSHPATAHQTKAKEEQEAKNKAVDLIPECAVRVDDQPEQQALALEVRVRMVEHLSSDTYLDTVLAWFVHLLLAEQLLLLSSYHGLHDLDWHLGPSLRSPVMLEYSRVWVLYWILGAIGLMALLFTVPASIYSASCNNFGREATFYIFSRRSGLYSVSILANPGVAISSSLLVLFHFPCCSNFHTSWTRDIVVFVPVCTAIVVYFAWHVFEAGRATKGSDIAVLRYELFHVDTLALLVIKAALFLLALLMVIFKLEQLYIIPWIHAISPFLAMLGIVLVEAVARGAWPYRCFEIQMRYPLDLIAAIDATCFSTGAILVAYKLDHPTWAPWGKTIAIPIVLLVVVHSLWLIVDFFRRVYSSPGPAPRSLTWLEPVLIGLDMDEELQYFEVHAVVAVLDCL